MEEIYFNEEMLDLRICTVMEEFITFLLPSVKELIITKDGSHMNISFDGNSCTVMEMNDVLKKIDSIQKDKNNFDELGGFKYPLTPDECFPTTPKPTQKP